MKGKLNIYDGVYLLSPSSSNLKYLLAIGQTTTTYILKAIRRKKNDIKHISLFKSKFNRYQS